MTFWCAYVENPTRTSCVLCRLNPQSRKADRQQPTAARPGPPTARSPAQRPSRLQWVCHESGTDRVYINHREHYVWRTRGPHCPRRRRPLPRFFTGVTEPWIQRRKQPAAWEDNTPRTCSSLTYGWHLDPSFLFALCKQTALRHEWVFRKPRGVVGIH